MGNDSAESLPGENVAPGSLTAAEFKAALSALSDDDPRVCESACDALFANKQAIQAKVIFRLRDETDPQIRSVLLELLGATKNPKHIPFLEKALTTSKGTVAFGAFLGLQRMEHDDAVQITRAWLTKVRQNRRRKRPPQ